MKVKKVINNNLVKSFNENNQEILVMGCGLGFKKSEGDDIDEDKIEKIYISKDKETSNKLISLLEKLPLEYIQAANEIVSYAKVSLGKKLNDNIYITLTDHISFAVERFNKGIYIKNALLWEIKRFYNHEFLIGKEALSIIKKHLNIELPEDEAGFITLHIVSALMSSSSVGETTEMTKVIQNILNIVKYHFKVELDENSLHYERFITHLKFFVQRVFSGVEIDDDDKSFLLVLKEQYKNEYQCALKIRKYIKSEYGYDLTEDELVYITVHIRRIITM
ncbi:BglG family transcription antiterminator LicT [[Clostridium] colinum]|uniref:BglG family transcription antiterminator LicT n=1 Tax=[Clostridium] colinum TaxID=36835 RepID=UPI002023F293|nr:PRD domain-containing protein [[Clostridium] colinum]